MPNPQQAQLFPRLAGELALELRRPHFAAAFGRWRLLHSALAPFPDAPALLRFLHTLDKNHRAKDAALHALLCQARTDPAAGRLVLAAILPGLRRQTRRLWLEGEDREHLAATVLACAWETIRRYPLARRRRVAANLLLDTLHRTLAQLKRERAQQAALFSSRDPTAVAEPDEQDDVESLLGHAVTAGAIREAEAELILTTRVDGVALRDAGERLGISYLAVKLRRQRAERRLLFFLGYPPHHRRRQDGCTQTRPGPAFRECSGCRAAAGQPVADPHEH